MTEGQLVLLVTSPRVPPGIMSYAAWQRLGGAARIFGGLADPQAHAITVAGFEVETVPEFGPIALAEHLVALAATTSGEIVWIGTVSGDPGLPEALTSELGRPGSKDVIVEVIVGSWDPPGARVLDLVAVMDRLRSPGGCPWDAEQTHASLVPYLLEEAYEAAEAIESGDRDHMAEELGDVLLQVVFHARVAEEDPEEPFSLDEIAAGIVEKLVRRHPHVFADGDATTPEQVAANWETIKHTEKAGRVSGDVLDGIPAALPALARATKVLDRLDAAGRLDAARAIAAEESAGGSAEGRLLDLLLQLRAEGIDAEAAARSAVRRLSEAAQL